MKYFKYIAFLWMFFAVACTTEDLGHTFNGGNYVQIATRIMPFADCNVNSRASKDDPKEYGVQTLDLIIFGKDGTCVYIAEMDGQTGKVIDRGNKDDMEGGKTTDGDFAGMNQDNLGECTIYALANFPEFRINNFGKGNTKTEFEALTTAVSGIDIPDTGMPMLGTCANTVNLKATATASTSAYEVNMVALYAKMVFDINVDAIQTMPDPNGEYAYKPGTNQFVLSGYEVYNVVDKVGLNKGKESSEGKKDGTNDTTPLIKNEDLPKSFVGEASGTAMHLGNPASFSFYLPARYLQAETAANSYNYPFPKTGGNYRDEDLKYRQRFKPLLAKDNATYVRFYGVFTDHQGHVYNVSYDIYVGNDNYSNFDIVRNTQYNNSITIRGISTSDDQVDYTTGNEPISIDHRVNVTRGVKPYMVNFRLETFLDSHFEVRPLRIRKNPQLSDNYTAPANAKVKIEVVYDKEPATDKNWIGLERSFGDGKTSSSTYLTDSDLSEGRKNAKGKRKYFTTDLTTNTLSATQATLGNDGTSSKGGRVVIVPAKFIDSNQECVWIYVDECTEQADDIRSAKIRISYAEDGNNFVKDVEYEIHQHKLFPVTFTNGTAATTDDASYLIEYHEEYLYNYDAEDTYGQTKQEGMQWGLMETQLSYDKDAILVSKGSWDYANQAVAEAVAKASPKYDFYLKRDIDYSYWNFDSEDDYNELVHSHNGYNFCYDIIQEVNGQTKTVHNSKADDNIEVLNLGQDPLSAIEYCFNKNKRNEKGEVIWKNSDGTWNTDNLVWYLPAIDEIEEIVMSQYGNGYSNYTYSRFTDFQEKMYWSSQPAYKNNYVFIERTLGDRHGRYMVDNISRARATSVKYENKSGKGVNDPENYEKVTSGMSGYFKYIDADYSWGSLKNTNEHEVLGTEKFSGSNMTENWSDTMTKPKYDDGALERTDMARVRCVRKIPTTTN